jgi:DNA-binding IclR family transcriptional regulator
LTRRARVSNIAGTVKRHSKSASGRPLAGTQAVVRALRLLRAFTDTRPEWGLADLSRELKLSKPTAHRLLAALEDQGLVVRQEPTGAFRLGPTAIELGARAQRASSVAGAARPEMESLTRATGETSSVEVLEGAETLILDEVQGDHLIGTSPSIGTRWPAHATSTGKVLLAAMLVRDPNLVQRMARRSGGRLRGVTPNTSSRSSRAYRGRATPRRTASWRRATWPSARRSGGTTATRLPPSRWAAPAPGSPRPASLD